MTIKNKSWPDPCEYLLLVYFPVSAQSGLRLEASQRVSENTEALDSSGKVNSA